MGCTDLAKNGAILGNPIGTGKSMLAQHLGRELDWPVLSSDQIRKTLARLPLMQRTAPELREVVYSEGMSDRTDEELISQGLAAISTNGGVILEATFSSRAKRNLCRPTVSKPMCPFR